MSCCILAERSAQACIWMTVLLLRIPAGTHWHMTQIMLPWVDMRLQGMYDYASELGILQDGEIPGVRVHGARPFVTLGRR